MERLSASDAAFLAFEGPATPMHVGALAVFDAGDLATPDGRLDVERATRVLATRLGRIPRLAQRLSGRGAWRRPAWRDDEGFDAARHVRSIVLPEGARRSALLATASRLFERPLDPERPLWEVWLVSGLEHGRFALVVKIHHALLDGAAAVDLLLTLLPGHAVAPASSPTRTPTRRGRPRRPGSTSRSLARLAGTLLRRGSPTPLNGQPARERSLEWIELDAEALDVAGRRQGGSANDALLAWVAGGLRRWLVECGLEPDDARLRALCPVALGGAAPRAGLGNQLGAWLVDLPVDLGDPLARVRAVRRATRAAKRGHLSSAVEFLARASAWLPDLLARALARGAMALAGRLRAYSALVTHVPAVPTNLQLAGAPLRSLTAFAPTFSGQRCSIAAIRYDGRIHVGLTGAWRSEAALGRLANALREEYELCYALPESAAATRRLAAGS
jgi:hypothetical protein